MEFFFVNENSPAAKQEIAFLQTKEKLKYILTKSGMVAIIGKKLIHHTVSFLKGAAAKWKEEQTR